MIIKYVGGAEHRRPAENSLRTSDTSAGKDIVEAAKKIAEEVSEMEKRRINLINKITDSSMREAVMNWREKISR